MISISARRRSRLASPIARVVARLGAATVLCLGLAGSVVGASAAQAASTSTNSDTNTENEPRLRAVRFELSPVERDGDGPLTPSGQAEAADYAELQVDHGGVARRLQPLAGSFRAEPSAGQLSLSVEIEGLRIGPAADGFVDTLSQVAASASVGSFVRIDSAGADERAAVDIRFPRPLEPGDYLLVQEAGGDDTIELVGLDAGGSAVGPTMEVGAPYRWNSGRRSTEGDLHWATIVDPSPWIADEEVTGLRLVADQAEVKVLVLEPATGVIPLPLAEVVAETSPDPEPGPVAAAAAVDVAGATAATPTPTTTQTPTPIPSTETGTPTSDPELTEAPPLDATPNASAETDGDDQMATTQQPLAPVDNTPSPDPEPISEPASESMSASVEVEVAALAAQMDDVGQAAPPVLAMTGFSTDPWVLVTLATGLIFFGYTIFVAFRRPAHQAGPGERKGHDQLDALGFD